MVSEKKQSALGRGFRIGRLGLSLTGSYFGYQAQNILLGETGKEERRLRFQRKASRHVREELQMLKGAVMKVGQALSSQTQSFPIEVTQELSRLQMKAPGMHPTLARQQFKSSLGKYPEEVFRHFEPQPFAAASLGQVHRAITQQGETVAVKIQYPAIRAAIENDFSLLKKTAWPAAVSGHISRDLLDEVEAGILQETDYLNEANNLRLFAERLRPLEYMSVPKVFSETSSDRVITMSFAPGVHLAEWLAQKPTQKLRDELGRRLAELFHFQLRRARFLHSDPHPGNYLFDGDRISLIDFGCVTALSPRAIEIVEAFAHRSWEKGETEMAHLAELICGPMAARSPAKARAALRHVIDFYHVVFPGGLVDFSGPRVIETLTGIFKHFVRDKLIVRDLVFVSRAELGLYNLLHQLRARVNTTQIVNRVTAMPP